MVAQTLATTATQRRITGRLAEYGGGVSVLTEYINAWVANDPERIAAMVGPECVVTECYGPVYRGRDRVLQWARTWFAAGGVVHRWDTTEHLVVSGHEVAQWSFECTWDGNRSTFEGATIARTAGGLIVALREYQTTAELYDWGGSWH
ncbi:nuclear transport factor 2 family protein [Microbacterium sp. NPDC089987]|uniref:nuclear transport factor 2 family protein n=1 Tax=Microbacterium sp. NPDC089987 TaxID=3364202 RepID=UPI00381862B1